VSFKRLVKLFAYTTLELRMINIKPRPKAALKIVPKANHKAAITPCILK
jgi:uncharacterized membrane protein